MLFLQEQNKGYVDWLTRWDSYLVNFAKKSLKPSPELKDLIRCGVPQSYRGIVWKKWVFR